MNDSPIEDSLWIRAFYQIAEEVKRDGTNIIHFQDVDNLVIDWTKMPIKDLLEKLK